MNRCESCKHYREYNDNKFAPLPLCTKRYSDLGNASDDFGKRDSVCEFYVAKFSDEFSIKDFNEMVHKLTESMREWNKAMEDMQSAFIDPHIPTIEELLKSINLLAEEDKRYQIRMEMFENWLFDCLKQLGFTGKKILEKMLTFCNEKIIVLAYNNEFDMWLLGCEELKYYNSLKLYK